MDAGSYMFCLKVLTWFFWCYILICEIIKVDNEINKRIMLTIMPKIAKNNPAVSPLLFLILIQEAIESINPVKANNGKQTNNEILITGGVARITLGGINLK